MKLSESKKAMIAAILASSESFVWKVIVRDGEVKKSEKTKNEYLSTWLYQGGSNVITQGKKDIIRLNAKKEAKYPYVFFNGTGRTAQSVWNPLHSRLEEGKFDKINLQNEGTKDEKFDAELWLEIEGKMVTVSVDPYYMRDSSGERMKQQYGKNAGDPSISKTLTIFIPEWIDDPYAVFEKELSRIEDWVEETENGDGTGTSNENIV